jgi:hypothetical protein
MRSNIAAPIIPRVGHANQRNVYFSNGSACGEIATEGGIRWRRLRRHDWRSQLPRSADKKAPTSGLGSWGERPGPALFGEEQSHDSVSSASDNSYFGEGAAVSAVPLFLRSIGTTVLRIASNLVTICWYYLPAGALRIFRHSAPVRTLGVVNLGLGPGRGTSRAVLRTSNSGR